MKKPLLDTESVSYPLRGHGDVGAQPRSHRPSEVCISATTAAALRFGAELKAASADTHGSAWPIGEFDVLIAAHAVSLRCVLVSNNVRHFSRVPGLVVENWT